MPASVFSEAELARLASFPEEIPSDDLIRALTLTGLRILTMPSGESDKPFTLWQRRSIAALGLGIEGESV